MADKRRVVITGAGVVSPFGAGVDTLVNALLENRSGISTHTLLKEFPLMNSHVAGIVPEIDFSFIPRHYRRSMTKMSLFAMLCVTEALKTAGHAKAPAGTAVYIGSTVSSMQAWLDFSEKFLNKRLDLVKSTAVFQVMNHSPLANLQQALDIRGPGLGASNACATGLMNIGLAYQAIRQGTLESALAGGTDEYHPMMTGCFAIMNAASSQYNDAPARASRPFDKDRGGIVCSEGCGIVYLETLDSAKKRSANILAEITGFAANTETKSISHPSSDSIIECMSMALDSAGVTPREIDLVNAHATSTVDGDIEEAISIEKVFGKDPPVNSLKGHLGHTMAASGSMELIAVIHMMLGGKAAGTLNLDAVDPACAGIRHFTGTVECAVNTFVKNSFALGGTNTSMVLRRYGA
ncbi:MAG: beta-ketoacyl-[acyl-carrier-protein] synthase family protein [Spirochaetota bacterium]|jgi:3-oxoacyl-[acyl-carrier-protein] synthase II|nr:beta-ketoacyl-[acyl-carrier-protein] synthase family protein [Spirochaetota bacterium]